MDNQIDTILDPFEEMNAGEERRKKKVRTNV